MARQVEFLVTGGAGFIGSNIVRRLVTEGRLVRVLDNLATGRRQNIADVMDRVEFIEGDIGDPRTAQQAVSGVANVLHLAALPSVPRSVQDPVASHRVNADGTLNLLVAARDAGVRRFVFSSSSSVYGDTPTLPKRENMTPDPLSPYAVQKLSGEHYCRIFKRLYGLNTFALRYFNVFGPRQNPKSQYAAVIPLFIQALRDGRSPLIYGDGRQTRDFTFVEDVISANLCCCTAPADAAGEVYNIACGRQTSIRQLAETLARLMQKPIDPVYEPSRAGDIKDSLGDASRANAALGWQWKTSFEAGLEATVRYFMAGE